MSVSTVNTNRIAFGGRASGSFGNNSGARGYRNDRHNSNSNAVKGACRVDDDDNHAITIITAVTITTITITIILITAKIISFIIIFIITTIILNVQGCESAQCMSRNVIYMTHTHTHDTHA